jgi:hypothetical protein
MQNIQQKEGGISKTLQMHQQNQIMQKMMKQGGGNYY